MEKTDLGEKEERENMRTMETLEQGCQNLFTSWTRPVQDL